MARNEVDLGEIIRNLLTQERGMLENFEKTEIYIEQQKNDIEAKVSKILKEEREKAEKEAEKIIEEQKKISSVEFDKIIKENEKEIKNFEKKVEKERKKIIDLSLQKIVEEVQDAVSRQTA